MSDSTSITAEQESTPVFTRSGFKAILRLNRPRQHNRIQTRDLEALQSMLTNIEADDGIRVLILTGTGSSFSSGYDLDSLKEDNQSDSNKAQDKSKSKSKNNQEEAQKTLFAQVVDRLEHVRMPTICALNGPVYGGSTDLALACDFRIGVTGIKMRMPAAQLGLIYYAGGMHRYVQRLGLSAAKKLFLTASTMEASELLRIGYLDEIVAPAELMSRTNALADTLAANAPQVVYEMKRFLNQIAHGEVDAAEIDAAHTESMKSEDAKEGIAAWFERRKPNFRGRRDT